MVALQIRYCECAVNRKYKLDTISGWFICVVCQGVVPCEICYYEDKYTPATEKHVDYYVCKDHLDIAIDNVDSRGRV